MTEINSLMIKELRVKTGAGIMDCKKALIENNGNINEALDWLRKNGIAGASKKAGRDAAEGLIGMDINESVSSSLVEINSETDFVAKNVDFQKFVRNISKLVAKAEGNMASLLDMTYNNEGSEKVSDALTNMIAKIRENIVIRRVSLLKTDSNHVVGRYLHNKTDENLGKIGCLVSIKCENNKDELLISFAKQLAMHISASKPDFVNIADVSNEIVDKEKEILTEQVKTSGKPDNVIEKIVEGKIRKFFSEVVLLEQNWVIEPSKKVKEIIEEIKKTSGQNISIASFSLFVLGEGVEKKEANFAAEVKSQINANR